MSVSMAILLAYFGLLILSTLVTIVTFLIWLLERKDARQASANALLISASICSLAGIASIPIINYVQSRNEIQGLKASEKDVSPVTKADMAGNVIEKAQAALIFKEQYPQAARLPKLLAMTSEDIAKKSLEALFNTLKEDSKTKSTTPAAETFDLDIREAIFEHCQGRPYKELPYIITDLNFAGSKEHKDFIQLLLAIDSPINEETLPSSIAIVQKQLPDGWYRHSLLKELYKSADATNHLRLLEDEHNKKLTARMNRYLAGYLLTLIFTVGGIAVGIVFALSFKKSSPCLPPEAALANCSLRDLYSQQLVIYYAQFLVGLPLGLMAALQPALAAALKEQASAVTVSTMLLNIVLLAVTTKLMLCKKEGVSLFDVLVKFFNGNPVKMAVWGVGGFFVLRSLAVFYLVIVLLVFKWHPASNSTINHQILDLAVNPNLTSVFLLWIGIAIFGPLYEEVAFRGILYPVLRRRAGVFWAIVLSAGIFAAFHMDLASFPSHFATGAGLAIIYQRTRSLLPCFITHMLWNSSVMLTAWLMT